MVELVAEVALAAVVALVPSSTIVTVYSSTTVTVVELVAEVEL